jgi:hypothetical protein
VLGSGDGAGVSTPEPEGIRPGLTPDESIDTAARPESIGPEVRPGESAEPGRPDTETPPERPPSRVVGENENQTTYQPRSRDTMGLNTLVPVNLGKPIADSLKRVEAEHGNIDNFVARELGYRPEDLKSYFGAEQVDAIALALDNIKKGKGFIIGDQTGIGKGRVNAAIIRWAIKNNRIPIFFTEKPNLYADIYGDLTETGFQDFLGREPRLLMTNADENIPLSEGLVLKTGASQDHNAMLADMPSNPEDFLKQYDAVLTNYSQMQTLKGKDTARRSFLKRIAPNSVLIMDESHNVGGQKKTMQSDDAVADRAQFARELVSDASGVFYSSATYAKRPDVMDLYAATDMALAVSDPSDLGEAIAKGGVPMQQAVAAMLARAGQYMRRERSFEGITYDTPVVPVDRETYDGVSKSLAKIQEFSEAVAKAVTRIDVNIKAEAQVVSPDGATGGAGAASVSFTSIMHNIINQMLLALKAKPAAEMAIEALKRGEKPVLTVSGTMESFLKDFSESAGLKTRDEISAGFEDVLKKYLDRTRTLIIRKPFAKKGETVRKYLTDQELGPDAKKIYDDAKNMIDGLDLSGLKVSPIDAIKDTLQKAGYRVGEITGRGNIIDYSGPTPIYSSRPGREITARGKGETIQKFNSGDYDALILNQSGSTGLSIHAGEKFADQRPRKMIIVQPEANIDTHMQLLGRINRTGQVVLPSYAQLVADIPAEKRPAAILAKKMASLNANTTGTRGSAVTAKDVPDFLNVYGDAIAATTVAENPELNRALGNPVGIKENGSPDIEDAMRKITGRIPLLPLAEQEELYQNLESGYKALLEQMRAAGENALEAQTMDLQAKTINSREVVPKKEGGEGSPFAEPVSAQTMSVKRLGKPFKSDEVINMVLSALGEKEDATKENALERLNNLNNPYSDLGKKVQQYTKIQKIEAKIRFEDFKKGILDTIEDPDKSEEERVKFDAVGDRWDDIHRALPIGTRVTLKTSNGNLTGIVIGIEQSGKPKNPLALSTWKAKIAVGDATRQISLPFSRLWPNGRSPSEDNFAVEYQPINDWLEKPADTLERFDNQQSEIREFRVMVTGNILAGYDWLGNKGRIVNYTDENGNINQGILTPKGFNLTKYVSEKKIEITDPEKVRDWLQENTGFPIYSEKDIVTLNKDRYGYYKISIDSAKRTGGPFYLDRELTGITGDFVKRGNKMVAEVGPDDAVKAISRLQKIGARFSVFPKAEEKGGKENEGMLQVGQAPEATPVVYHGSPEKGITKFIPTAREALDAVTLDVGGRAVQFIKPKRAADDHLVLVDPKVFDAQFAKDKNMYIGPGGTDNVIGERYRQFQDYLANNDRVEVPEVSISRDGQVSFINGRHRYAVMRDAGMTRIPVALTPDSARIADPAMSKLTGLTPVVIGKIGGHDMVAYIKPSNLYTKKQKELTEAVAPIIERIAPGANLAGAAAIRYGEEEKHARGAFVNNVFPKLIAFSLEYANTKGAASDLAHTLRHEAIHYLKGFGFITPEEWQILRKAALEEDWITPYRIDRRYQFLDEERKLEEAVAERFGDWRKEPSIEKSAIRAIFYKLDLLFRRLAAATRRVLGFKATANDIFTRIDTGEIGRRPNTLSDQAGAARIEDTPYFSDKSPPQPANKNIDFNSLDPNTREGRAAIRQSILEGAAAHEKFHPPSGAPIKSMDEIEKAIGRSITPKEFFDRIWDNYAKDMSPDEFLKSEALWSGAREMVDRLGWKESEAFSYIANEMLDRMGATRRFNPQSAARFMAKERGIAAVHDENLQVGAPKDEVLYHGTSRASGGRVLAENIDPNPTEAQKRQGNYKKEHVSIQGLDITIENAKGSFREGKDKDGKPWKCKLPAAYGYIKRTEGNDGDHLDCYLGPHIKSPHVYVVDQLGAETGKFDEHKIFIGFPSKYVAINTFHQAFSDGKAGQRFGHIKEMTMDEFKEWLDKGDQTKPVRHKAA